VPYIPSARRAAILAGAQPEGVGELTYVIYRAAVQHLPESPCYADYAEVVAALENAKLEFYHRHVRKYEDRKIIQNGDVR